MKSLKHKGFTMIELLVVIAIIGILAAIAYPSYQESVRKGRRNDGQAVLMEIAGKQEIFYARNASYTTDLALLNATDTSPEGYYTITIPLANSNNYTLQSVPKTGTDQTNDTVQGFRMQANGIRLRNSGGTWVDGWTGN